jgi:hypothetical protein
MLAQVREKRVPLVIEDIYVPEALGIHIKSMEHDTYLEHR